MYESDGAHASADGTEFAARIIWASIASDLFIERFWTLEEKINQDKMDAGVQLEEMSRSKMRMNMIELLKEGAISLEDLKGFSEEFIESVSWATEQV